MSHITSSVSIHLFSFALHCSQLEWHRFSGGRWRHQTLAAQLKHRDTPLNNCCLSFMQVSHFLLFFQREPWGLCHDLFHDFLTIQLFLSIPSRGHVWGILLNSLPLWDIVKIMCFPLKGKMSCNSVLSGICLRCWAVGFVVLHRQLDWWASDHNLWRGMITQADWLQSMMGHHHTEEPEGLLQSKRGPTNDHKCLCWWNMEMFPCITTGSK